MVQQLLTPKLHLALGTDAAENANWEKIDAALGALAVATIIPGNLQVQGDLDVTGNAHIAGALDAASGSFASLVTQTLQVQSTATIADLVVTDTTPTFAADSIPGASLAPNAAVRGVWIGNPGSPVTLTMGTPGPTTGPLAMVATDATEDPARWDLIFGQVTMQIGLNTDPTAGQSSSVTFNIQLTHGTPPGDVLVQSRSLSYTMTKAGFTNIPLTLTRIAHPPAPTDPRWNLTAFVSNYTSAASIPSVGSLFGQLHVMQFR